MWVIVLPSLGCTDDLASSAGEELAAIVVLEPQLGFLGSPPAVETYLQSVESGVFCSVYARLAQDFQDKDHQAKWKEIPLGVRTDVMTDTSPSHINGPLVWAEDPEHGVSALDDVSMFLAVTIQGLPSVLCKLLCVFVMFSTKKLLLSSRYNVSLPRHVVLTAGGKQTDVFSYLRLLDVDVFCCVVGWAGVSLSPRQRCTWLFWGTQSFWLVDPAACLSVVRRR